VDRDRPDERVKKDDHRLDALEYALMVSPPPREEADTGKWREYLADGLIAPGTADLERARS
jgi:hypothetical protein